MDRYLIKALESLDCTPLQIKLFVTSYNIGSASIPELAKASKIKRSSAYVVANELLERGLLIEDHKNYKKQLIATEPADLLRMVSAKHRSFGRVSLALSENISELEAQYQATNTRPKVRTFEGFEGLSSVWKDILTAKTELLLWTNQEAEQKVFNEAHHNQFIAERCRKNISIRVLAVDNKAGNLLIKNDAQFLRKTRILPKNVDFSTETYIYDNKIAMLDHNKAVIGIIIQSEQIANAHRAMFESNWSALTG